METNLKTGLIPIQEKDGKRAVNARDLHAFLESKQRFVDWIKGRIEKYGFIEGKDYQKLCFDYEGNLLKIRDHNFMKSDNQHVSKTEYALSIGMAKELAMVEGNEKGKQARKYFIECEEKLTKKMSLPQNYIEALETLVETEKAKQRLELENKKLIEDNLHNRDVIEGLVYEIPLADMRQRINQIVRGDKGNTFQGSWHLLYSEFERKYHLNIGVRMDNKNFSGNKMDFIEKELKMIPEMYDMACKLFESSYSKLMKEWGRAVRRASRYN